jgi:hypothetical protein
MADGHDTKRLNKPLSFTTAGGQIQSYCTVPTYSHEMGSHIAPYLLPQTPPVLSIGKRCMEEGYAFHWEAGEAPYLVTPDGGCISLLVENNIPYLNNSVARYAACPSKVVSEEQEHKLDDDTAQHGDDGVRPSDPDFYGAVFDEEHAMPALPEKEGSDSEDEINNWETAWKQVYSRKHCRTRVRSATAMPCIEVKDDRSGNIINDVYKKRNCICFYYWNDCIILHC